jgi:hypothetical protein
MHANQIGNDIQICEKYTDEYFATQELFKWNTTSCVITQANHKKLIRTHWFY